MQYIPRNVGSYSSSAVVFVDSVLYLDRVKLIFDVVERERNLINETH